MSKQRGTPTIIRIGRTTTRVGIVTSVSTPTSFTAHFHTYEVGEAGRTHGFKSYGYWDSEVDAVARFEEWVEQVGGLIG